MKLLPLAVIGILLLIPALSALPTNGAATGYAEGFNLSSTGNAAGDCYFRYYNTSQGGYAVKSQNFTTNTGGTCFGAIVDAFTKSNTLYAWTSCDNTGCSASWSSVATSPTTPSTLPTLGWALRNLTEQNYPVLAIPYWSFTPYTWIVTWADPTAVSWVLAIIVAVVVVMLYAISGFRSRGAFIPLMMIIMSAGVFLSSGNMFGIIVPQEFVYIVYAATVGAFVGWLVSIIK